MTGDEAAAVRDLGDAKLQPRPSTACRSKAKAPVLPWPRARRVVLGFVAPDGIGKDGLELALDEDLHGKVEDVRGLRDRSGRLVFEARARATR